MRPANPDSSTQPSSWTPPAQFLLQPRLDYLHCSRQAGAPYNSSDTHADKPSPSPPLPFHYFSTRLLDHHHSPSSAVGILHRCSSRIFLHQIPQKDHPPPLHPSTPALGWIRVGVSASIDFYLAHSFDGGDTLNLNTRTALESRYLLDTPGLEHRVHPSGCSKCYSIS